LLLSRKAVVGDAPVRFGFQTGIRESLMRSVTPKAVPGAIDRPKCISVQKPLRIGQQ
jgi:hypothetical protein